MPTYTITSPHGETLKVRGDKPPGPEDLDKIFAAHRAARYQKETANPEAKPSAGESFASGVGEVAIPGAKGGESVTDQLKSAPGRVLGTLTDPESWKSAAKKAALGPLAIPAQILEALSAGPPTSIEGAATQSLQAGAGDLGTLVADIIKRGGGAVGSGDPNELARSGGNVTGLALQALLAGKAPAAVEAGSAKVLPFVKGAATPAPGSMLSALAKGASELVPDVVSGPVKRATQAFRQERGGPLSEIESLKQTEKYVNEWERLIAAEKQAKVGAAPKPAEAAAALPDGPSVPTAPLVAEAPIAPKPPSIITDAEIKAAVKAAQGPVERHALRQAKKAAEKGDEGMLRQLLGKTEDAPMAAAAEPAGGVGVAAQPQPVDLASLLRTAEPVVPGPAASLEDLLRLSIEQAKVRKGATILPDGQRAMPGGRSGLAVSETAPKSYAPDVTALTDLEALLREAIPALAARRQ